MQSLQVVTTVRQVKTLVVDGEIRDTLRANSDSKAEPVVNTWIFNLVLRDVTITCCECYMANLTTPSLDKRERQSISLEGCVVVGRCDIL